jgi:hypothetical protein
MLTTDEFADAVGGLNYTAFGELLDSAGSPGGDPPQDFPRFQFAGQLGIESGLLGLDGVNPDLPLIFLAHAGDRWFQPDIGRFVQRDPAGIASGLNVYLYAGYLNAGGDVLMCVDYDDVKNRDGSTTRHFYDRGWTGWFKNEYLYSVRVPANCPPPRPPRTIDERLAAVCKTAAITIVTGAVRGAAGGPEGVIIGIAGGFVVGIIGGIGREVIIN